MIKKEEKNKRKYKNIQKRNNGITLIALIVTIIVLLILAGATIAILFGENGILTMATRAKEETEIAQEKETVQLAVLALKNDVMNEETLKEQVDSIGNTNSEVKSIEEGEYLVTFPSKRAYEVDKDGNITYIDIEDNVMITANKESDLNAKQIEEVEITVRRLEVKENENITIKYCWNTNNKEKPKDTEYKVAEAYGTNYKQKAKIMSGQQPTGNYYLWIKVQVGTKEIKKTYGEYYIQKYTTIIDVTKEGTPFLGNSTIQRGKIKSVTITNSIEGKKDGEGNCWDVSTTGEGFILAWYDVEEINGETYYNVTIGQNGKVVANANSRGLFYDIGKDINGEVKIEGLQYLDTSKVINMRGMFSNSNISNIDVSSFDTSNVTTMEQMFENCSKLKSIDITNFNTYKVNSMYRMFYNCSELINVEASGLNISSLTTMQQMFNSSGKLTSVDLGKCVSSSTTTNINNMFNGCTNLKDVILGNINASSNVTNMFTGCNSLTNLDLSNLNTSNVLNMSYMFSNCSQLANLNLSNLDTTNVTNMTYMFNGCSNLNNLDLSNLNTISVSNMSFMFNNCFKLENLNIDNLNTSNVKDMSRMFYGCTGLNNLDLSGFNTDNVTSMGGMFRKCSNLINLNLKGFNTSNVNTMAEMFSYCSKLTNLEISDFKTSNVTTMAEMFSACNQLTNLDLSHFDTSIVTNMGSMFSGCGNLANLNLRNWIINEEINYTNIFASVPTNIKIYVTKGKMEEWVLKANTALKDSNVIAD